MQDTQAMDCKDDVVTLFVYPALDGYIGRLQLPDSKIGRPPTTTRNAVHTIVVLDRSGSMGTYCQTLVQSVLPVMFGTELQYPPRSKLTLITFSDSGDETICEPNVEDLLTADVKAGGQTYMRPALQLLEQYLADNVRPGTAIRLLALSDGALHDQLETLNFATTRLLPLVKRQQLTVSARAVRLLSSSSAQPDTRGLASLLQLDTTQQAGQQHIVDIQCHDLPSTSKCIAELFATDGLDRDRWVLRDDAPSFCTAPWNDSAQDQRTIPLADAPDNKDKKDRDDWSVVWLRRIPSASDPPFVLTYGPDGAHTPRCEVRVVLQEQLTPDSYGSLMRSHVIEPILQRLKVLKVVNTPESHDEASRIARYFADLERSLEERNVDLVQLLNQPGGSSLRSRFTYYRALFKRRAHSVAAQMAEIANNDKVAKLNAAQQADWMRTIPQDPNNNSATNNRNGRSLARRALQKDLDFDSVVRREIEAMAAHIDAELKGIDDADHLRSFYSQSTTLEGIRSLCDLAKNDPDALAELSASDAIKLLNLVGLAVDSPIGDYPDPMTWRVTKVYLGCYVSLSDVLVAGSIGRNSNHFGGGGLKPPVGGDKPIANVVPLFDDARVYTFLKRHAPTLLEYTAGVGMRRMLAEVPQSFLYTLCAGVWYMVEHLDRDRSELAIATFSRLVHSYKLVAGRHFAHIVPHLTRRNHPAAGQAVDQQLSHYLGNNGITNLISPLMMIIESGETHNMQRILRALHNYETWQAVKRQFKHHAAEDNKEQPVLFGDVRFAMQQTLNDLLGVDLTQRGLSPRPLFEPEPSAEELQRMADSTIRVNEGLLKQQVDRFYYVKYVALLPRLLECVLCASPPVDAKEQKQQQHSFLTTVSAECIARIRQLPSVEHRNDKWVAEAFGVDYPVATLELFHVAQALLHPTRADRVDADAERMRVVDVATKEIGQRLLADYVRKQYLDDHQSKVRLKIKREREVLRDDLVRGIVSAVSMDKALELWRNGLQRGQTRLVIESPSSQGFVELRDRLLDVKTQRADAVPCRADKLAVMLLGRDSEDKEVWNNGNVLIGQLRDVETVFGAMGLSSHFDVLRRKYYERNLHQYRAAENRHGHSNDKPSYWARGYPTLDAMVHAISPTEWEEYRRVHADCCGVNR